MRKSIILLVILCNIAVVLLPSAVSAQGGFHFVPCGNEYDKDGKITNPCKFPDLIIMIVRVINYLISVAAIVAMYQVLSAGFWLTAALGNPEKIEQNKKALSHAVVGFGIIILAFVMVNLLVSGLFGTGARPQNWFRLECIYGIGEGGPCQWGIVQTR